jgi:hypothetical protein
VFNTPVFFLYYFFFPLPFGILHMGAAVAATHVKATAKSVFDWFHKHHNLVCSCTQRLCVVCGGVVMVIHNVVGEGEFV